jgi:uncharacterized membrane protein YfhO
MEPGGAVIVSAWSPNRIELRARGPGRLVLSEISYPGWQARADGERVPILEAHGVLRSVDVPAGEHTVVFVFRPVSVYAGMTLTVAGALALVALAWPRRQV